MAINKVEKSTETKEIWVDFRPKLIPTIDISKGRAVLVCQGKVFKDI